MWAMTVNVLDDKLVVAVEPRGQIRVDRISDGEVVHRLRLIAEDALSLAEVLTLAAQAAERQS